MKALLLVLLLPAVALCDGYLVRGQRLYVSRNAVDPPSWERIDQPGDWVVVDGRTPDPKDPDDPKDTLTSRIEQRARLIDEPNIAKPLGLIWGQWAKAMRESGTSYDTALSGIDALLPTLLRGSARAEDWGALHALVKGELTGEPKTAATFDKVAAGYSAAGGASQINFGKLIECILCFIEAWSSAVEGDAAKVPLPSVLKRGAYVPPPLPQSVKVYATVPDEIVQLRERLGWRK